MPSRLEKMAKEWSVESKMGLGNRLRKMIYPPPPMRQRIAMALYRIKVQVSRLEHMLCRLQERDKVLFEKVIDAQMAKDTARATIYANEVAEIRKIAKTLLRAQLALEQIALRLETIQELGDILVTMAPIVNVIKDLKKQLMGVVPEIAFELSEIDELLHSVIIEAGEFTGHTVDFTIASSEAKKILEEASVIAEQRMKEKFPELPSATSVSGEKLPTPPKQS
ncbi:MAG TPA: hypothetical protein EYH40_02645 [Desulfurococcales archaeon]|nr:hypothetical protein [Desulfurococcales archaeon]